MSDRFDDFDGSEDIVEQYLEEHPDEMQDFADIAEGESSAPLTFKTGSLDYAPHVALFVTGGIAVYKACEVLRNLQKAGCDVRICMTHAATLMVGEQTFEALSGHHVTLDVFGDSETPIPHIDLAEWADLALVCPATANTLAKMAHGFADNAVTSTLLACTCPVVVAPAMNTNMWNNFATQENMDILWERGIFIAGPVEGHLACGTTGAGKLADVDAISEYALAVLSASCIDVDGIESEEDFEAFLQNASANSAELAKFPSYCPQDLAGTRVVITAGPTHEAIDPVRYLANASSGKMGYALATAAAVRGAEVVLVAGPTTLPDPLGVETVHVTSAAEMLKAASEAFETADAAILSAAVCDYTPTTVSNHKLKKANERLDSLKLTETVDILATLSKNKGNRVVIGFAAETDNLLENAQAKLERKGCDAIVANDVSRAESTFGSDTNDVYILDADGLAEYPVMPKREVANAVMGELIDLLSMQER